MKWQKKINKSELKHIKETTDSGTLDQFKRNREHHLTEIAKGEREPCFECKMIASKLEIA